ncbi:adenine deaminase [Halobacillus sp. Nhm2S1]|uniref:adenine deaminase n=1 Tax=Halobacillus sp. Nhm2S1 TaxID=2866716 RepID=UPI001C72F75F|nr:adenine deaminase [Halobacillus sp. Nhm2S1]MBX0357321.1 adenine deaminase [Halobacillus sp. Nhm2S1]
MIETLKKRIRVANKERPADLVIKNAQIVDVFNGEIIHEDVAIVDGFIAGLGEYEGKDVIDAQGQYMAPSFIDAHVHIESSMVPPSEFAKVVIPHGVTTVITDPHEIGNVLGKEGIQFMLDDAKGLPMDFHFMLPSSVPATPFETSGAELQAADLQPFLNDSQVLGLGEVMDYSSLQNADPRLLEKIAQTIQANGYVDGHLAGLNDDAVNLYTSAGVQTDHECNTPEEALARIQRGMYVSIREGSAAKDLHALLPIVNEKNARRCHFCTDDKHIDDLLNEGSIDHHIRLATAQGFDPITAIQMATLNAAECYGLHHKGAIAPGYMADFLFFEDLHALEVTQVFKKGKKVASQGTLVRDLQSSFPNSQKITNSVHIPNLAKKQLRITIKDSQKGNIIKINKNQIRTDHLIEKVEVESGTFQSSVSKDQLKLVVIERHHHTGNIGLGIVKGMGLKKGAIATTIAHDSHNIVAVGTNDEDIIKAIQHLGEISGGMTLFHEGTPLSSLPLPIAGLMSDQGYDGVADQLVGIHKGLSTLGFTDDFNPFLTLSFLTLPVIPSLKLTDKGLFSTKEGKHISVSI